MPNTPEKFSIYSKTDIAVSLSKSSNTFIEKGIEFSEDFEKNKKILGNTMPSKKLRNRMAGFLSRVKKQNKKKP